LIAPSKGAKQEMLVNIYLDITFVSQIGNAILMMDAISNTLD
jgi:hypothetical protein